MTDVKTARDLLDECKMSAAYNDARPHEESGLLIAALTAAGYQITPIRADDGVRVEAAARYMADQETGVPEQWQRYRHHAVEILAAADAVAGAGRDVDARDALRPFAHEADRISPPGAEKTITDDCEIWQCGNADRTRSRITYGDLRRARAALAPAAGEDTDHA